MRPLVPSQKLSYPEVSQDRNYTVGVIAFPHISSFRFLRMHRDSTTATVPEGRFHFTYTQTARLSRYACVIALNTMTMQDEGRYAVTIGNELGEFQFFFWVHFTHGKPYILGTRIAQWLERRTHDRKVRGSSSRRSGGRIFFSNFLC